MKLNSLFNLQCAFYDRHYDGNGISRADSPAHSLPGGNLSRGLLLISVPSAPQCRE